MTTPDAPAAAVTSRSILELQNTLRQAQTRPWEWEVRRLDGIAPAALANALSQLDKILQTRPCPENHLLLESARRSLASLGQQLQTARPWPHYPLAPAQSQLWQTAMHELEQARQNLSLTLHDSLEPWLGAIATGQGNLAADHDTLLSPDPHQLIHPPLSPTPNAD